MAQSHFNASRRRFLTALVAGATLHRQRFLTATETDRLPELLQTSRKRALNDDEARMLAAMCKLFASETSKRAADQAVQIHGGYGFMEDYPVARYWRDVKINEIGEGTSEVQRMLIARLLGC